MSEERTLSKDIISFTGISKVGIVIKEKAIIEIIDLGELIIPSGKIKCEVDDRDDDCLVVCGQTNNASFLEENMLCSFSGLIYFREEEKGYLQIQISKNQN